MAAWKKEHSAHTHRCPLCTMSSACKSHGAHLHFTGSEKSYRKETCFFDYKIIFFSKTRLLICSVDSFEKCCFDTYSHCCCTLESHGSFKKLQAWAPPNSLDSLRVEPGACCFFKAPQMFLGCGKNEDCYFIMFLGWVSHYKAPIVCLPVWLSKSYLLDV